jgi:multiple sugar transport system permease protein
VTTIDTAMTDEVRPATAPAGRAVDRRMRLFNVTCAVVLVVFALIWLVPLLWAVDTALKPNAETTKTTWQIAHPTLASFRALFAQGDIFNWYAASFITSAVTAAVTVLTASMAAFALSRLRFRYRRAAFVFVLAGIMIPGQALIVPQYREMSSFHLLNTYWAVILPQIPVAVAVFIFKQFFDGLPGELEEAARLDGAGFLRIYSRVIMPLTRPVVSAVAIFTFVWTWNNLLWPLLVLNNPKLMTIPVGIATVQGAYGIRYADTMASSILAALPLLLLFLFFQRRMIEGIANTGLKG